MHALDIEAVYVSDSIRMSPHSAAVVCVLCYTKVCTHVCVWRSVLSVQVIGLYKLKSLIDMTGGDCCDCSLSSWF